MKTKGPKIRKVKKVVSKVTDEDKQIRELSAEIDYWSKYNKEAKEFSKKADAHKLRVKELMNELKIDEYYTGKSTAKLATTEQSSTDVKVLNAVLRNLIDDAESEEVADTIKSCFMQVEQIDEERVKELIRAGLIPVKEVQKSIVVKPQVRQYIN